MGSDILYIAWAVMSLSWHMARAMSPAQHIAQWMATSPERHIIIESEYGRSGREHYLDPRNDNAIHG